MLSDNSSSLRPPFKKRKYSEDGPSTGDEVKSIPDLHETRSHLLGRSAYSNPDPLGRQTLDSIVKEECDAMVQLMDQLKLWIILSSPRIDGTANQTLYHQQDILEEFHRAQASALNIRDATRENHLSRAKICSKLIKYPGVKDYLYALKEHDEQHLYLAHQHLRDIRNMYLALNDMIRKSPVIDILSCSQNCV